jgi:outer membrane protein
MKKVMSGIIVASALGLTGLSAERELVCFDSMRILQEAKENQIVAKKLNGEIEELQGFVKASQQKLIDMQTEMEKKRTVLSKEAIQEKIDAIEQEKKNLERIITDKKDKLEKRVQAEQNKLRVRQIDVINKVCKDNGWGVLVDKNAPGVVYASADPALDKTDILITEINKSFDALQTGASKTSSKPVNKTLKTA